MVAGKKPMTKAQVVTHIAQKCDIPKKSAVAVLEGLMALAVSEAKKVGSFVFPGLGKLVLVQRKARMGRNPATGEPIKIPAKKVVKMRIAKACKDAILPKK
jgi:DNA-binding protein HU-beta